MTDRESYRPVEALERGLEVLSAIGEDGVQISQICARTGINRTTLYRVLHTLERNGYLFRSSSDHRYRLSIKVRDLSDGFNDSAWVTQIGLRELVDLFRNVSWPGNLATFDGRHMLIRESTHRFSPLMSHRNMVGKKMPLSTSLGLAYLAFSPDAVRHSMLGFLIDDLAANGFGQETAASALTMLGAFRTKGYATQLANWEPGVGGIAMPIMGEGHVLACMQVVMREDVLITPALLQPIAAHLLASVTRAEAELGGSLDEERTDVARRPRP